MRSRAGTSSMNTIDLFREIMQKDLQECRRVPGLILDRKVVRRRPVMFTHPHFVRLRSLPDTGSLAIFSQSRLVDMQGEISSPSPYALTRICLEISGASMNSRGAGYENLWMKPDGSGLGC